MGKILRCITADGAVAISAIDSTDIVARAESIHQTSAVVTAALGRMLSAASMMGAMLKGEKDSLTLRINGKGPAGTILVTSDSSGNVKGYAENPVVEIPLNSHHKLDVAGAIGGEGTLAVIRDMGEGEPYVGQVPIISGEIAEDITYYYATSEQIPTVCALGVLVNPDLTVNVAGGFLIQLLPTADGKIIDQVEQSMKGLPSVTQMLSAGMSISEICRRALSGMEIEILEEMAVQYRCDCSLERVERAICTLGSDEIQSIIREDGMADITCQFCDQVYHLTKDQLENLAKKA